MTRRYVIIIGAMKSGTTTLFDLLAEHAAIAPASYKEPGFFAFDAEWNKGFDWFDTLFDFDPDTHVYRLEASTDYTKAPFVTGVWARMTANPDVEVKLLYIMRHPIRRIESHARHVQVARREIGREVSERPDHSLEAGISPVNIAISQYADQLDVYGDAWAIGRLHCLTLEDLKAEPNTSMARIWAFLDLDPLPQDSLPHSNARNRTRPGAGWKRLTSIGPLVALGKLILPQSARQALRARAMTPVRAEGRFTLTEAEPAELQARYAPDLDRLEQTYGVAARRIWSL